MMLRQATAKIHGKLENGHLVALEWVGEELLIENWADWVAGSHLIGPVYAFDSFERRKSKFNAPRPDNYPAPEPSYRLRVHVGFDVPAPVSVLLVGDHTPKKVTNSVIRGMPEGAIVVLQPGQTSVARSGVPLLHCSDHVAIQLQ
jgi:hypothetical protein